MNREGILEAAKKCVCGDRDEQYGSPEYSFKAIADLWSAYLTHAPVLTKAKGSSLELSTKDVAALMILFKVGRIATGQNKADNWIDIAGYAACGGEVEES